MNRDIIPGEFEQGWDCIKRIRRMQENNELSEDMYFVLYQLVEYCMSIFDYYERL